jgi:hypothetical protein
MSLILNNISASHVGNDIIGLTGSLIIGRPGGSLSAAASTFPSLPGNDVILFVSGVIDGKNETTGQYSHGVAAFGGDAVFSGVLGLEPRSTEPSTTTDKLYNKGQDLYWMGTKIQSGSDATAVAGSDTQVQYNNGGEFGGAPDLTYNDGTGDVTIGAATTDAKLNFGDTGTYVYQSADGVLDVVSDGTLNMSVGAAGAVLKGTTPKLTIGDAGAEDTFLVFDGNAQDYRIGLDDGTDKLEIGVGATHGTTTALTIDSSQQVTVTATTAASSTTDGALAVAGGLSVAADVIVGDDVKLISDSAVLSFGVDSDTTLTHTDGTGLALNSDNKLTFGAGGNFVQYGTDGSTAFGMRAATKLTLTGANVGARAVDIGTAGGVYVGAQGGAGKDITLSNGAGSVYLYAGEAATDSIRLNSNAGGIVLDATSGKVDINADELDVDCDNGNIDLKTTNGNFYATASGLNMLSGSRASWPGVKLYSAQGNGGVHIEADNGALMRSNAGVCQFTGSGGLASAFAFKTTDASGGIHFDVGNINMDTSTTLDIDSAGALTIDSATSIAIGANADKPIDIDSTTLDIDASGAITLDTSSGGISIDAAAGAVNLTSAASTVSVTGAGGGSFGDDTGTWEFDGSGAVTETGMTSLSATPSGAITLTAGAASTWSTSAGALTLTAAAASTWSTSAGALVIDGAAGLTLDSDGTDAVNLGTEAAAKTITIGNAASTKVDINALALDFDSAAATDILAASTLSAKGATGASFGDDTGTWEFDGSGAVTETGMTSLSATPSGAITLTAGAASTWSSSAGALTLTSAAAATWSTSAGALTVNGTGGVNLQEGGTSIITISDARALSVGNTEATTVDIDCTSTLSINSTTGVINVGNDDVNNNINIGTDGTRTIRVGASDDTSTVAIYGGAADIVLDAGSNDVSVVAASIQPSTDLGVDLGTSALRFGNIYTGDLHLANSRGNWTIVEEESMLTIRNNSNGRWFQLNMTEIDSSGRDDGMNGPPPLSTE